MSFENFCLLEKQKGLSFDTIAFFVILEHQDNPNQFLNIGYEKSFKNCFRMQNLSVEICPTKSCFGVIGITQYQIDNKIDIDVEKKYLKSLLTIFKICNPLIREAIYKFLQSIRDIRYAAYTTLCS